MADAVWWWTVMGLVVAVVDTLAAHRLTRFATRDHFPPVANLRANLVEHYRYRTVRREDGTRSAEPNPWARGFTCPWCVAPWVVLLVLAADAVAYAIGGGTGVLVLTLALVWPAMSTLVGLLAERDGS